MIFVIFILLLYFYYCYKYNNKINDKAFNIIKNFCNYKSNNLINVICLLGDNKKRKYNYTKIIANFYNRKIIYCNLHKLHNTNDIKELFFHKDIICINDNFYNIPICKRLFVFNLYNYQEYIDYTFEIANIIKLLNFFICKNKFVFIFIINNKTKIKKNLNNNHLHIYLHKKSFNCIHYNDINGYKTLFYF